jgi:ketosteroid isomerase-like protein
VETMNATERTSEEVAVVAAARDYFEGWFDGDVKRMDRALHPDLVKRRAGETLGIMTKERMLELAARGEGREDAADRTLDVDITGIYDDVASATVRSAVYHEYLHLVRTRNGWKIANTLWQLTQRESS